ncbi:MAG: hypothetical protein ACKN9W_00850 [Methylococcus sp.]
MNPSLGSHASGALPHHTAASTPAVASPPDPYSDSSMMAYRRKLVSDKLQLKPESATKFWPIYDKYQKELELVRDKRHAILIKLGENFDNMSDADAAEYVRAKLDLEENRARINRRAILDMGRVLKPRELARYVQIEAKIKAFIEAGIEEEIPLIQ